MTSRNYDVILKVSNANPFRVTNAIVGNTTSSVGYIAGIDLANNLLKVKLANVLQEFSSTERIHSNAIITIGTSNGILNTSDLPFQANIMSGNITTAIATVSSTTPSTFIAEKNAFTQNPIVRLYSVYYPGEWYPPNANGNPTGQGAGRAWPSIFPLRFAEIVGDLAQDISYNVSFGGVSFLPYPINVTGLEQSSDGKINELSVALFNVDNMISRLVEDPYLAGNNISNSVLALVNGEYVHGIDPRTVDADYNSFDSSTEQYISIKRARDQGLDYDPYIVDSVYGMANASFSRDQTLVVNGKWQPQKMDTRDLLGGVVEIKTTFANFLDYWPEYSKVVSVTANVVTINNALPYRVGDVVSISSNSYNPSTILAIDNNERVFLDKTISKFKDTTAQDTSPQSLALSSDGTKVYIAGNANDKIVQYSMSTPWDISTAVYSQNVAVGAYDSLPFGLAFSSDGTFMYISGMTLDNVRRFTLSSAWNVSTATISQTFSVTPYDLNVTGITFDNSGSNMYLVGDTNDKLYQFSLSNTWDIATAVYSQNVSIVVQDSAPTDLRISSNGSRLFMVGSTNDSVHQYDLSTAWDISTATYSGATYLGYYDTAVTGIAFDSAGSNIYLVCNTSDDVYQLNLTSPWDITTVTSDIEAGTPLYINNPLADSDSFLEDKYKIDQLESLTEQVATFGLISWLQYFKVVTPKRKYYKNTCQWQYKGSECQYPGPSNDALANAIPGTNQTAPPYAIAANNAILSGTEGDVCAKSLTACAMRNNTLHFGGFPGVGRTVPRV